MVETQTVAIDHAKRTLIANERPRTDIGAAGARCQLAAQPQKSQIKIYIRNTTLVAKEYAHTKTANFNTLQVLDPHK